VAVDVNEEKEPLIIERCIIYTDYVYWIRAGHKAAPLELVCAQTTDMVFDWNRLAHVTVVGNWLGANILVAVNFAAERVVAWGGEVRVLS